MSDSDEQWLNGLESLWQVGDVGGIYETCPNEYLGVDITYVFLEKTDEERLGNPEFGYKLVDKIRATPRGSEKITLEKFAIQLMGAIAKGRTGLRFDDLLERDVDGSYAGQAQAAFEQGTYHVSVTVSKDKTLVEITYRPQLHSSEGGMVMSKEERDRLGLTLQGFCDK